MKRKILIVYAMLIITMIVSLRAFGTNCSLAIGPSSFVDAIQWAFQGQWNGIASEPFQAFPNLGSFGGSASWVGGGVQVFASSNGDGSTNRTTALNTALTAGDVFLPVGTGGGDNSYVMSTCGSGTGISIPSYRTLQCAPGATIKDTCDETHTNAAINFAGTNSAIIGCTITGLNSTQPPHYGDGAGGQTGVGNNLIFCGGVFGSGPAASHILIKGNTVKNSFGITAIRIGDVDGTAIADMECNDVTVEDNDIENSAYYAIEVGDTNGARIIHNRIVDGGMGSEPAGAAGKSEQKNIVWAYNYVSFVNGICFTTVTDSCNGWSGTSHVGNVFVYTCASGANCDATTDFLYQDYVTGSGANNVAQIYAPAVTGHQGAYENNILANGATCSNVNSNNVCYNTQ